MLLLSVRFPYLNDKIKSINELIIKKELTVPQDSMDALNSMIYQGNTTLIYTMPELDQLYMQMRRGAASDVSKIPPIPKFMNERMREKTMNAYLYVCDAYRLRKYSDYLFDMDAIWEYLPKGLQDMLENMYDAIYRMTKEDIYTFNMELHDLKTSLNPFVIDNELDKLILIKDELPFRRGHLESNRKSSNKSSDKSSNKSSSK